MLLPVDRQAHMGILSVREDSCHINPSLGKLCNPGSDRDEYNSTEIRQLGPMVTTIFGEQPIGAWLIDLVTQKTAGVSYARGTVVDSTVIDALVVKGEVYVVINSEVQQQRRAVHDLRNHVNGIKMNAELAKMLAIKGSLDRLRQAAESIIGQCDGLVSEHPLAATGMAALRPELAESPVEALRRLHETSASCSDVSTLMVAMPRSCTRDLFTYISHFLAILRSSSGDELNIAIEPGMENRVVILCRSTDEHRPAWVFDQLQGNDFEAFISRSTSTHHLPTSVYAYEIAQTSQQFQMTFQETS